MNTLIIFKSYHHMSTEKIAKAMAETLNAKTCKS
jgi:flavodoxin